MKGTRSYRLALSVLSVLFIVGGLFLSVAIYAAKRVWPDPYAITRDIAPVEVFTVPSETAQGPEKTAPTAHLPEFATDLDQPRTPRSEAGHLAILTAGHVLAPLSAPHALVDPDGLGPSLKPANDMTDLPPAPALHATARADGLGAADTALVYSLGSPVQDIVAPDQSVRSDDDAQYQLDMLVAALAEPVDISVPPPPPADVFALASDSPHPSPDTVFAMAEPDTWPQRVDHAVVLDVSQSLAALDFVAAPAASPAPLSVDTQRLATPTPITAPALHLADGTENLRQPPSAPVIANKTDDDDLIHQIAKVLAATPLPLPQPKAEEDVLKPDLASAPTASPRPLKRRSPEPRLPSEPERIAEPFPRPPEPAVGVDDLATAQTPVAASIQPDDGRNRMSVIGIYQTNAAAWALLEFSDGRIIKATKGTSFNGLRVARIGGDRVWLRDGGTEKGIATGQVVVLD